MMKKKMAWVALAMAMLLLLLLLTASPSSLFVASAAQQLPGLLQFSHNGRFKILQVADMHYANGAETACEDVLPNQFASCSDLNTTTFLNRMIEAEKPDLIVFTGDNIYGLDVKDPVISLNAAFAPAVNAKIPWAAVLGNHDQESTLTRAELMSHIVTMDYTLSRLNPDVASEFDHSDGQLFNNVDGYGNYNLEVAGAAGSELEKKSVLNLYFVDSGDYSTIPSLGGYGWIKASQQVWLKHVSEKLQDAYRSTPAAQTVSPPGLAYFHIPLPEVDTLEASNSTGVKQEGISSASINSGFLATLLEAGDVKAAFTGHDHVNDFCGAVHGISLCYAGGFGYHAYGKAGWARRARVVLASLEKVGSDSWGGVEKITTWKRLDDQQLSTIDLEVLWSKTS
ncbi:hypothetical protein O6H91_10G012700 [Diphasiastrum complanatum]|nr:hypothetical protein O6H91_10G012700 [Diphasiastrum complanatum]